jgi:hypothetical protein
MKTTLHSIPFTLITNLGHSNLNRPPADDRDENNTPFHSILISIVHRQMIEMKNTRYSNLIAIVRQRIIEMKILYKIKIHIILISIVRRLTIEMTRNVHNAKAITYVLIV